MINKQTRMTAEEFVVTATKRDNPAAWLAEVERNVKRMRKTLGIPVSQGTTPTPATHNVPVPPPDVTANLSVPEWLKTIHKSKRIRGVSR